MDKQERARLRAAGWTVGPPREFLGLSDEEAAFVEFKLALSNALRSLRAPPRDCRRSTLQDACDPVNRALPRWRLRTPAYPSTFSCGRCSSSERNRATLREPFDHAGRWRPDVADTTRVALRANGTDRSVFAFQSTSDREAANRMGLLAPLDSVGNAWGDAHGCRASVHLRPRLAHDLRPLGDVGVEDRGELLGRGLVDLGALRGELVDGVLLFHHRVDVGVDLPDHRRRRAGRREQAEPRG